MRAIHLAFGVALSAAASLAFPTTAFEATAPHADLPRQAMTLQTQPLRLPAATAATLPAQPQPTPQAQNLSTQDLRLLQAYASRMQMRANWLRANMRGVGCRNSRHMLGGTLTGYHQAGGLGRR
jgi:hypothetical protein